MNLPTEYAKLSLRGKRDVRRQYINLQKGLCYFCKAGLSGEPSAEIAAKGVTPGLFPPGFFNNPIHLHHSHETGLTIGAVHAKCNAVLWEHHNE